MKVKILESTKAPRLKVVCRECGDGDVVYVKEFRCFFTPVEGGVIRTTGGGGGKASYLFCRSCQSEYNYKYYRKFLLKYYSELCDK
jgi:hypothetical protein